MENILFIGFYDYSYGMTCQRLIQGQFVKVELSETEFDLINNISHNFTSDDIYYEEVQNLVTILETVTDVIVCEDGSYWYSSSEKLIDQIKHLKTFLHL